LLDLNLGTRSCRLLGCWLCASICWDEADWEPWCWNYLQAIWNGK